MFICAVTGKTSKPREPMLKVVVETRDQTYSNQVWDSENEEYVEKVSHGHEIVREVGITKEGLEILRQTDPNLGMTPDEHEY